MSSSLAEKLVKTREKNSNFLNIFFIKIFIAFQEIKKKFAKLSNEAYLKYNYRKSDI